MKTHYWPAHSPAPAPEPAHGCAPAGCTPFGTAARLLAAQERDRTAHLARIRAELHAPTPTRFVEVRRYA